MSGSLYYFEYNYQCFTLYRVSHKKTERPYNFIYTMHLDLFLLSQYGAIVYDNLQTKSMKIGRVKYKLESLKLRWVHLQRRAFVMICHTVSLCHFEYGKHHLTFDEHNFGFTQPMFLILGTKSSVIIATVQRVHATTCLQRPLVLSDHI